MSYRPPRLHVTTPGPPAPERPPLPVYVWLAVAAVVLAGVILATASGCNSQQIMEEADAARKELTAEQTALVNDVTAAVGGLVTLRQQIYETLTALMGTGDDVRDRAVEEARDRLTYQMTEQLRALAARLTQHAEVIKIVCERLNKIYSLALDDSKLLALLTAPAGFFGIPPMGGGGGVPGGGGRPPTFPWGETIGAVLGIGTLYGGYRGVRWGVGAYKAGKAKREAFEDEHRRTMEFLRNQPQQTADPPKADSPSRTASQRARRVTVSGDEYDIPGRN